MSESTDIDLSDPEVQQQVQGLNPNIRAALGKLGDVERSRLEAEARYTALERELAVERAGIPNTPIRELFLKAYDGPSDPEAIKAKAAEYGLFDGGASQGVPAGELADHRQIVQAGAGAIAPNAGQDLAEALRHAKTPAEVLAIVAQAPTDARIGLPGAI